MERGDWIKPGATVIDVGVSRTESGIEQRVHPTMVPKSSSIAQVMGVTNAVTVDAEGLAPITLVGPGAGGMATASAVVAAIPVRTAQMISRSSSRRPARRAPRSTCSSGGRAPVGRALARRSAAAWSSTRC